MNFGKSSPARQNGNAMIYVLLALALIGVLTATMMRQDGIGGDDISADQVELQAIQILEYASAAQMAIDQMLMSGANPDNLDFALPSASSFNTAPYHNKIFHPQGGGLNHKALNPGVIHQVSSSPAPAFYLGKVGNVEWTKTSAPEIMFAAYQISRPVCENLNKKITGTTTIPATSSSMSQNFLAAPLWVASNEDLTKIRCPGCEGYSTLCVSRGAGDAFTFYSVIVGR